MTGLMKMLVIGMLVFSSILFASLAILSHGAENYGVPHEVAFSGTLNITDRVNSMLTNQSSFVEGVTIDENSFLSLSKEGFKVLAVTFVQFPKLIKTIFSELTIELGLPVWFATLIYSLVLASLVFVIILAFFKV